MAAATASSVFTGTLDKCKACDKKVYFVELLSADGETYHKSCFKCTHCRGTLAMSSYSSMDGVLYCKHHFDQLFKQSGNFTKNFHNSKPAREVTRTPNKLSAFFCGTQDKCFSCKKTVYPLEKVTLEEESYHKSCFKCAHGRCPLTHSSYAALNGVLYCKYHFQQLFMLKGNFQHVLQAAAHRKNAADQSPAPAPAEVAEQATVTETQSDEHDGGDDEVQQQHT